MMEPEEAALLVAAGGTGRQEHGPRDPQEEEEGQTQGPDPLSFTGK